MPGLGDPTSSVPVIWPKNHSFCKFLECNFRPPELSPESDRAWKTILRHSFSDLYSIYMGSSDEKTQKHDHNLTYDLTYWRVLRTSPGLSLQPGASGSKLKINWGLGYGAKHSFFFWPSAWSWVGLNLWHPAEYSSREMCEALSKKSGYKSGSGHIFEYCCLNSPSRSSKDLKLSVLW